MGVLLVACSDDESYADKKEKERNAIDNFINRDVYIDSIHIGRINPISEDKFYQQDSTTNLELNEYVRFGNGVYMQIVRKGPRTGKILASGEASRVIVHYIEYNIMADSVQTRNDVPYFEPFPDIIEISNNYGTFTASFNTTIYNGRSAMYQFYNSTSVPAGWLVPFSYIKLGRLIEETDETAKVRLIVPHSQGHSQSNQYVCPYFYELTFYPMRD